MLIINLCADKKNDHYCQDALFIAYPDSKVHVANMGPTWVLTASDGPMNLAISVSYPRDNGHADGVYTMTSGVIRNAVCCAPRTAPLVYVFSYE